MGSLGNSLRDADGVGPATKVNWEQGWVSVLIIVLGADEWLSCPTEATCTLKREEDET